MRSVVRSSRTGHSTAAAVAVVAVVGVVGVVAVAAVSIAAAVVAVAEEVCGWPSLTWQCRLAAVGAVVVMAAVAVTSHGSLVENMVPWLPFVMVFVADYFVVRSYIAEPVQWDSVYALVVADIAITIQQLMSLSRNIQIHCLQMVIIERKL